MKRIFKEINLMITCYNRSATYLKSLGKIKQYTGGGTQYEK